MRCCAKGSKEMLPRKRSAKTGRRTGRRRAYTLIEMLIVITLMGILTAILLPKFEPSTYEQLQGASQIIAADLSYARSLAVTNDSQYTLTFSASDNAYTLRHTGANNLLDVLPKSPYRSAADSPDSQETKLEDLPHLGASVEIVGVRVGSNALLSIGQIEFSSLGGLSVAQPVTIVLACGQNTSRRYLPITIAPVTGLCTLGTYTATLP